MLSEDDIWRSLTASNLKTFIIMKKQATIRRATRISPTSTGLPSTIPDATGSTFVVEPSRLPEILPGVHRNVNEYPKLKEDKLWMAYHRTLKALAAVQGIAEVLDVP